MEKPGDVLKKLGVTGILTLPPEEGGVSQLLCDTMSATALGGVATSTRSRGTRGPGWSGCQRRNTGRLVRWRAGSGSGGTSGSHTGCATSWRALRKSEDVRWPGSRHGRRPIPRRTSPSSGTAKPLMLGGGSIPVGGGRIQIGRVHFLLMNSCLSSATARLRRRSEAGYPGATTASTSSA